MMATESISMLATNDNPPPISITIPKRKDLPRASKLWKDVELPVDFLLLTVKEYEFLSCYYFLKNSFKSCFKRLGIVYFGEMGGDHSPKLRVALMTCSEGSSVPNGSLVVVKNAVSILRPKAVFCVGACLGLQRGKAKLGDVVVSSKLTQYAGKIVSDGGAHPMGVARVPVSRDVSRLVRHAGDGWKAPLSENPSGQDVEVHCDAEYLSGPEFVHAKRRCDQLVARHPEALAIDMEGEGESGLFYFFFGGGTCKKMAMEGGHPPKKLVEMGVLCKILLLNSSTTWHIIAYNVLMLKKILLHYSNFFYLIYHKRTNIVLRPDTIFLQTSVQLL